MCGFSILLILKEFWRFKVILLNKNVIKTEQNQKWKIPHTVLERRTLCFSSCKNRQFLYRLFCPNCFLIFVFYVSVYFIEYTFRTCTLLHIKKSYSRNFLLVFKIVESFHCILNKLELTYFCCCQISVTYIWYVRGGEGSHNFVILSKL